MKILRVQLQIGIEDEDYSHYKCSQIVQSLERHANSLRDIQVVQSDWNEFPENGELEVKQSNGWASSMDEPNYDWTPDKKFCNCNTVGARELNRRINDIGIQIDYKMTTEMCANCNLHKWTYPTLEDYKRTL